MKTIWKFPIAVTDEQFIDMPDGAEIIHIGTQMSVAPCIWAICDARTKTKKVKRCIRVVSTGNLIDNEVNDWYYHGTFMLNGGAFVGHVFEKPI